MQSWTGTASPVWASLQPELTTGLETYHLGSGEDFSSNSSPWLLQEKVNQVSARLLAVFLCALLERLSPAGSGH